MAGDEHQPQHVVLDRIEKFDPRTSGSSRPSSSNLPARVASRRISSIARRLAAVISQAPGWSGIPDVGHCSSAATNARPGRNPQRVRRHARYEPGRRSGGPRRSAKLPRRCGRRRRWSPREGSYVASTNGDLKDPVAGDQLLGVGEKGRPSRPGPGRGDRSEPMLTPASNGRTRNRHRRQRLPQRPRSQVREGAGARNRLRTAGS